MKSANPSVICAALLASGWFMGHMIGPEPAVPAVDAGETIDRLPLVPEGRPDFGLAPATNLETALVSVRGEKLPTERWKCARGYLCTATRGVRTPQCRAGAGPRGIAGASLIITHVRLQI